MGRVMGSPVGLRRCMPPIVKPTPVIPAQSAKLTAPKSPDGKRIAPSAAGPDSTVDPQQLCDKLSKGPPPSGSSALPAGLSKSIAAEIERRHAKKALEQATGGLVTRKVDAPPLSEDQQQAWRTLAEQGTTIDMVIQKNGHTRSVRLDLNPNNLSWTQEAMAGNLPLHVNGTVIGLRISQPLPPGTTATERERLTYRRTTPGGPLVSSVQTDADGRAARILTVGVNNPGDIITFVARGRNLEAPLELLNRSGISHEPSRQVPTDPTSIIH